MIKNKYKALVALLFSTFSLLITLAFYNFLPNDITVIWSSSSEEVLHLSKFPYIFVVPLVSMLISILLELYAKYDHITVKRDYVINVYHILAILFAIIANIMQIIIIATQFGFNLTFNFIFYISSGLLFAFIGNYIPRIRPSKIYFMRFKLFSYNPKLWFKSQRLRGYSLLVCGVLIMICPLINEPYAFSSAASLLILAVLINYIYVNVKIRSH
jgi:uncharacterized membrane protein